MSSKIYLCIRQTLKKVVKETARRENSDRHKIINTECKLKAVYVC